MFLAKNHGLYKEIGMSYMHIILHIIHNTTHTLHTSHPPSPPPPSPPWQVKGIMGPNRGLIGQLINIDEGDGIVKLDADAALKIISLNQLAKHVPR